MPATLDHIVVIATSLEEGDAFCAAKLGVRPSGGGAHTKMGTHNHLLRLGDGVYLEVIAIDPHGITPDRPRWFGMDDPAQQKRLRESGPFLATFMGQTDEIIEAAARVPAIGPVLPMQRGDLAWELSITEDGGLRENGTVPGLIQWPAGVHPSRGLPEQGCRLLGLEAFHPDPDSLRATWNTLGFGGETRLSANKRNNSPYLAARILTPAGEVLLSGE